MCTHVVNFQWLIWSRKTGIKICVSKISDVQNCLIIKTAERYDIKHKLLKMICILEVLNVNALRVVRKDVL